MAEFCLKCFPKVWLPNAYECAHLVPSKHNELCESCMNYLPCVDSIDYSECRFIKTSQEFSDAVTPEIRAGRKIACVECGAIFYENDDLAFVHDTGECPYCHSHIIAIWIKA